MQGFGDGIFEPSSSTTRAQLVTILWNMEGRPGVEYSLTFTDVADSAWYASQVRWATINGYVNGYNESTFGPNDAITREQLVTILYRYSVSKGADVSVGEDTNILDYTDAEDVSTWAMSAMQWAVGSGLVNGRTETTLNPTDTATRAEIATIMMRYMTEN